MKEKIHVVFSPDENYAIYAGVAMASILYHAFDPVRFHFYFLQGDRPLSDASRAKLDRVVKKYGAAMSFLEVDVSLIAGFAHLGTKRIMKRISAAAYYRLLIPDLLKDLERCIYLDCDLIALGDLAELWDTINPNTSVAAVCDCYIHGTGSKKFEVIECYFNSGVLLMNLRLWRDAKDFKHGSQGRCAGRWRLAWIQNAGPVAAFCLADCCWINLPGGSQISQDIKYEAIWKFYTPLCHHSHRTETRFTV
jgi:lipopolysaccharide biosynthesis glycosyltransferase